MTSVNPLISSFLQKPCDLREMKSFTPSEQKKAMESVPNLAGFDQNPFDPNSLFTLQTQLTGVKKTKEKILYQSEKISRKIFQSTVHLLGSIIEKNQQLFINDKKELTPTGKLTQDFNDSVTTDSESQTSMLIFVTRIQEVEEEEEDPTKTAHGIIVEIEEIQTRIVPR
ncbi:hypothetical protein DFA_11858 [Cavenderia fasciculata]|uniref:Uncharacterized protein n=1 Tax=Cavenderia fasciculata TaxID=261658 RepID=F4QEI3_CACFS|nr:uncharacterized protein DFA_11858 [Cavenderia fasciculata]EGG14094.1 hypothetical protein DFA_11858 [Cavenderia fasciculata]|eukprot:XP_004350802.1 hypothetical protein DFA_11858 [Cavenderia fasciculata]